MPELLVHSGGRRWGWGLVTFALWSGLSPSTGPGPRRCLRDCGLPRDLEPPCFLTRPAPATESAGDARGSLKQAENPLAHHRLVAAIIVTRRDAPPPPPEKPGGWGQADEMRRRRLQRGCAQAQIRTPSRNWRAADCGSGMSAAWIGRAQAQLLCLTAAWGVAGVVSGFPRRVCNWVQPMSRLRPAARIAQSVAGEALRGDRTKWMPSSGAGELEGGRSGGA